MSLDHRDLLVHMVLRGEDTREERVTEKVLRLVR